MEKNAGNVISKELLKARSSYISENMAKKLIAFILSDDEENCNIPASTRHELYKTYSSDDPQKRNSTIPDPTLRKSRRNANIIPIALYISGITLKDLLAKLGQDLALTTQEDMEMGWLLSQIPENSGLAETLHTQSTLMVSDFWYYDELSDITPTLRFTFFRARKSLSERTRLDEESMKIIPNYDKVIADNHRAVPIEYEDFPKLAKTWHISPRWLYSLPDGCCAFLPNEYADKTLSNFMCMGNSCKQTFSAIARRELSQYGIR